MVVLHEHPLSPYAQKVKIALAEKGITFESRLPDILGGNVGEFAALNPRLEVPALVDGDVAIFDSTIILEYLEDRWPTPPLLPASPAERARVRMLEELCDTYYEAINWAIFEIRVFQRATGELAARLATRAARQRAACNTTPAPGVRRTPGPQLAPRRLARARRHATQRVLDLRGSDAEHGGIRDAAPTGRVWAFSARVP